MSEFDSKFINELFFNTVEFSIITDFIYTKLFEIMETRPLSKDKRWRVVEILEKAK